MVRQIRVWLWTIGTRLSAPGCCSEAPAGTTRRANATADGTTRLAASRRPWRPAGAAAVRLARPACPGPLGAGFGSTCPWARGASSDVGATESTPCADSGGNRPGHVLGARHSRDRRRPASLQAKKADVVEYVLGIPPRRLAHRRTSRTSRTVLRLVLRRLTSFLLSPCITGRCAIVKASS